MLNSSIGPNQVLPLRVIVDLGAMATKGYSAFPKAPDYSISYLGHTLMEVLPLCKDSVGVFYSPTNWDII